jgi:hypothetical protein
MKYHIYSIERINADQFTALIIIKGWIKERKRTALIEPGKISIWADTGEIVPEGLERLIGFAVIGELSVKDGGI